MNNFLKASRLKLRFQTSQGSVSVEDLWDLPLQSKAGRANLDDIAINLSKKLKESDTESFVTKTSKASESDKLAFEIVKEVISVKMEESSKAEALKLAKEQKEKILAVLAKRQEESLDKKSEEELKALLESLPG